MTINKKTTLNLLLVFALLLSVIAPNVALAYTTTGDAANPTLTIYKYVQDSTVVGDPVIDNPSGTVITGKPLEGVTFQLTLKEVFNQENNTWSAAPAQTVLTGVTDATGKLVFNKDSSPALVLGRYDVQETDGPADVILNTNVFSVDIPQTNAEGTELNYNVEIYPKNQTIRGDGELIKVSQDGTNVLPGVVFNLYKDTEPLGTSIQTLTTDVDGKISFAGLKAGKYVLIEQSTVGNNALNNTPIKFEVKKDGTTGQEVIVEWTAIEGFVTVAGEVVTATNYLKPTITKDVVGAAEYSVDRGVNYQYNIKVTVPKDIKKYSEFVVTDTLDSRLTFVSNDATVNGVTFAREGQKLTWTFDPKTVVGNQEVTLTFTAKIKSDAVLGSGESGIPNQANIKFDNNQGQTGDKNTEPVIVIPTQGGFTIIKVDKADNSIKLPGAEFKLTTDEAGNTPVVAPVGVVTVNELAFSGDLVNLTTNADGKVVITGLPAGTYYLHETKAPTYTDDGVVKPYRLLTKPLTVKVTSGDAENNVTVENAKSGWNLPTTGGMGTILFTFIGIAFMGIAFFLFSKNKRVEN